MILYARMSPMASTCSCRLVSFGFAVYLIKTLPLITDETLKQEVIGFVRQEAAHARAHEKHRTSYVKMVTTFKKHSTVPILF